MKEFRGAISVHHTKVDTEGSWDAGANLKRLGDEPSKAALRTMHAWVDPEKDAETKAAYKLPHHNVSDDGNVGAANFAACSSAMGRINGGGLDIPDADRKGVYRHIAAHYEDADKEPPELKSNGQDVERRCFQLKELRVNGDGDKPKIVGHAAVFNQLSEEMWGFKERIAPGAFKKTIKEADVRALFNHDPNYVLGRNKSGTLSLAEDDEGLAVEIDPPETDWARDLMKSMDRGDVDQMSFAFLPTRDKWEELDGELVRTVLEVRLFDVSVVTFPAYPQTDAQVRAQVLLNDIGLDFRALSRILLKANHDLPVAPADQEYLKYAVDLLSRYLPVAPGQVAHPTDNKPPEDAVTAPVIDHPVIDISTLRNRMAMNARVM